MALPSTVPSTGGGGATLKLLVAWSKRFAAIGTQARAFRGQSNPLTSDLRSLHAECRQVLQATEEISRTLDTDSSAQAIRETALFRPFLKFLHDLPPQETQTWFRVCTQFHIKHQPAHLLFEHIEEKTGSDLARYAQALSKAEPLTA